MSALKCVNSTGLCPLEYFLRVNHRLSLFATFDPTAEVAGVTFSDSAPVPKVLNPDPEFFKFENPTLL